MSAPFDNTTHSDVDMSAIEKITLSQLMETTDTLFRKKLFVLNEGVIERDAFHLMGATSKRNDSSKIGYFGSGLKYAIAWLLRNDVKFNVYSDGKEIKFGVKEKKFRGSTLSVITINGKETSLTTDMGPDWSGWFAMRELICNALDENKGTYGLTTTDMVPAKGTTLFLVEQHDLLADFMANHDSYFTFKRTDALFTSNEGAIYSSSVEKPGLVVYRKGVRCYAEGQPSIFNYDFSDIGINESRVVQDTWGMRSKIAHLINISDVDTKRLFLQSLRGSSYEWHLFIYDDFAPENWLDAFDGKKVIPPWVSSATLQKLDIRDIYVVPDWLYNFLSSKFKGRLDKLTSGDESERIVFDLAEDDSKKIDAAISLLMQIGIDIVNPVKKAVFRDVSIYGEAENGVIYVSEECLEKGIFTLMVVLTEEQFHITSGFSDKTREFQTYILEKLLHKLIAMKGLTV